MAVFKQKHQKLQNDDQQLLVAGERFLKRFRRTKSCIVGEETSMQRNNDLFRYLAGKRREAVYEVNDYEREGVNVFLKRYVVVRRLKEFGLY